MKQVRENSLLDRLFLFILLVFIPILYTDKTLDPNLSIQSIFLILVLGGFFLSVYIRKKTCILWDKKVLFFLTLFIFFIGYSLLSVIISNNIADAIYSYLKYVLFFLLIITFLYQDNIDNIFKLVSRSSIVFALIVVIPGYFQLMALMTENQLIIPLSTYNIQSIFPHRNLFSEMLLLTLPFSVYSFFSEKMEWKYVSSVSYSLSLLMLIILSNRASWLGIIVISVAIVIIFLLKKKLFSFTKLNVFFTINTLFVLLISMLLFSYYADTTSLKSHTVHAIDSTQGSTKDRYQLWTRTITLISESPIIGNGLGSWKINMLKYGNKDLCSEDNITFYQRPHNDFLWIAAEQGIIGIILYALLFLTILWLLIILIFKINDKMKVNQLLVILAVTGIFIIISLFSFPKERISHNIILFTSWGLLLGILNTKSNKNNKIIYPLKGVSLLGIILLVCIFSVVYLRLKSEIHTKKAILLKKNSRFEECIQEISQAESFFYTIDETSTPLTWYAGLAYFNLGNYQKAVEQLEIALQLNPYHIYTLNDYASSLAKINQQEKAIVFYKESIRISPNFIEPKLNLCALYYNENRIVDAFNILKNTDTRDTTNRYKQTVTVIIQTILDKEIKSKLQNREFIDLYTREQSNYSFYKKILIYAKQHNLQPSQLINSNIFKTK